MYHDYSLCPECHRWISGITLQHAQKIGDIVTCIHCNKHIVLNKLENVTGLGGCRNCEDALIIKTFGRIKK